jgi:hypothetical protein
VNQPTLFDPPNTSAHCDDWWMAGCLEAIRTLAATGRPFQAYDLLALGLAEPERSSWWGCAFKRAKAEGVIRRAGYAPSRRPTVRGSACAEWVGA